MPLLLLLHSRVAYSSLFQAGVSMGGRLADRGSGALRGILRRTGAALESAGGTLAYHVFTAGLLPRTGSLLFVLAPLDDTAAAGSADDDGSLALSAALGFLELDLPFSLFLPLTSGSRLRINGAAAGLTSVFPTVDAMLRIGVRQ